MLDRRAILWAIFATALFPFLSLRAQTPGRTYRIGALWTGSQRDGPSEPFVLQLKALGYETGKNLVIESLYADWKPARYPEMAQEIVRRKPDLIFAPTRGAAEAAKKATRTIPIVFALAPDPVGEGLITSLSRPGGNVTGSSNIQTGLTAKRLQLFLEVKPGLGQIAAIYDPADKVASDQADELQKAANELKIQVRALQANNLDEYQLAFEVVGKLRIQAVFITGSVASFNHRKAIASLAIKHRLPTMNTAREYVQAGGLISYGPELAALYRQAATYVDRILRGAKPADLPVEQPNVFEMLVNRKTARALDLRIPQSVLLRADRVIE